MSGPDPSSTPGPVPDPGPGQPRRGRLAWLQWVFLALVLGFGGWWVVSQWDALAAAWDQVRFWPVVGALTCGLIGAGTAVPIWRTVLAGMGSRLRWRSAARIVLIGQLGKYVPGGIWPVVVQSRMAREEHVPLVRSAAASLMSLIISLISAIALGAAALVFAQAQILADWWWVLLLAFPLLALLHPTVIGWLGSLAGAVLRRPVLLPVLSLRTVLATAAWALGGQVVLGLQYYLLFGMVGGVWTDPLLAIGLFQLANAAGIVVVIAAAGAGPRELILVAGSAAVIGQAPALLAGLLSRAVLTVVDFVLAVTGWLVGRRRPRSALSA